MDATQHRSSEQFDGKRLDFEVAGHGGFVLLPPDPTHTPTPWVWYAPTFIPSRPAPEWERMFERMLKEGFAVAGVDVEESFGSPAGRAVYVALYERIVGEFDLSPTACLLPQSRGGLMLYNWAAENADKVRCIGGVYPVCDMSSYPGLKQACGAYGLTEEELAGQLARHNPIERLEALAKAGIPILHIHGDSDSIVPLERNSNELARRYRELGGAMDVIVLEGKGHDASPEFFQNQRMLDFFREHGLRG